MAHRSAFIKMIEHEYWRQILPPDSKILILPFIYLLTDVSFHSASSCVHKKKTISFSVGVDGFKVCYRVLYSDCRDLFCLSVAKFSWYWSSLSKSLSRFRYPVILQSPLQHPSASSGKIRSCGSTMKISQLRRHASSDFS